MCWHIPAEVRNDPHIMRPATCKGCPIQYNSPVPTTRQSAIRTPHSSTGSRLR
jgi:hypothetical protein